MHIREWIYCKCIPLPNQLTESNVYGPKHVAGPSQNNKQILMITHVIICQILCIFFPCFQLHKAVHDMTHRLPGFLIRMPMSEICQGGYPTESQWSVPVDVLLSGVRPTYESGPILQQEQKPQSERLRWGGDEAAAGERGGEWTGPVNCSESN